MNCYYFIFFFKQKTAYEMRISDWSSDVCSSDLIRTSPYSSHSISEIAVQLQLVGPAPLIAAGHSISEIAVQLQRTNAGVCAAQGHSISEIAVQLQLSATGRRVRRCNRISEIAVKMQRVERNSTRLNSSN